MSFCLMETHCKACNKAGAQEETAIYSKLRIQILWCFSGWTGLWTGSHILKVLICLLLPYELYIFIIIDFNLPLFPHKTVFYFSLLSTVHAAEAEGRNGYYIQ